MKFWSKIYHEKSSHGKYTQTHLGIYSFMFINCGDLILWSPALHSPKNWDLFVKDGPIFSLFGSSIDMNHIAITFYSTFGKVGW